MGVAVQTGQAKEMLRYWQIVSETRHALEHGAAEYEIDDLAAELEGMMINTDNPGIRRGCTTLLARCRPIANLMA